MTHDEPGPQGLTAGVPGARAPNRPADDVGVAIYDQWGRPRYLNHLFCRMVGSPRERLLEGASPLRHWVGPRVLLFGPGSDGEVAPEPVEAARFFSGAFRHPDGGGVPVNLSVLPLSSEGAQPGTMLLEVRAAAAGAGRHAVGPHSPAFGGSGPKARLLAEATVHECNNVFAVIRLAVGQAMASPSLAPELMPLLELILDASVRGAAIAGSMLRLGEGLDAAMAPSDLDAHIRSLASLLAKTAGAGIEVRYDLAAGGKLVSFEPAALDSVLINLVANARNAMPAGGTIAISSRNLGDAAGVPASGFVEVRLSDQGVGMSSAVLSRAFDPWFTTSEDGRGAGLGLPIARELMQRMGGELLIESDQGRGTTAVLRLRPAGQVPAPAPAPAPAPGPTRLLVVEDDPALRELAELVLAAEGYEVTTAADAQQALGHLERRAFDLMFSDVLMPGMGGTDLAELAAQRWPRMRTLLTSGYMEHVVSAARSWPMLPKPYEPATLVREVTRVLKAGDALGE